MTSVPSELAMFDDVIARCMAARTLRTARIVTRLYDQALSEHGLTITQFTLMIVIGRHKPNSLSKLAEGLDIERSTLSRNIAKLRDGGFVETVPSGRAQHLRLTRKGQTVLSEVYPKWQEVQASIETKLGEPELLKVREALGSLQQV